MPRKKSMPSKETVSQSRLISETVDAVNAYVPLLIRPANIKILIVLARAYLNNEGLIYSRLGELTGLGTGRAFNYPMSCLKREGFVREVTENKRTIFMPTDAGLVAIRGITALLKTFVEDISNLEEVRRRYPKIAEGYDAVIALEKKLDELNVPIEMIRRSR